MRPVLIAVLPGEIMSSNATSQKHQPRRLARNSELARYLNTSAMSIWRWQHDEKLKFPQPFVINNISYTDLEEVDEWLRSKVRDLRK